MLATELYSFYEELCARPLEDANARMAAVERFFAASAAVGAWPRGLSTSVWADVALAAALDSWSMIRRKAAAGLVRALVQHPAALAFPTHHLLARLRPDAPWFVCDGALALVARAASEAVLARRWAESYDAVAFPMLQRAMTLVSHPQQPVRAAACGVCVALTDAALCGVERSAEARRLLEGHAIAEVQRALRGGDAALPALEGSVALLLALPSGGGLLTEGSPATLVAVLHCPAASVRFEGAELLSRVGVHELLWSWRRRLVAEDTALPTSPLARAPSWQSNESFLLAALAVYRRESAGLCTREDAQSSAELLTTATALLEDSRQFEVERAARQLIPFLVQCWMLHGAPTDVAAGRLAALSRNHTVSRWMCWFAAIGAALERLQPRDGGAAAASICSPTAPAPSWVRAVVAHGTMGPTHRVILAAYGLGTATAPDWVEALRADNSTAKHAIAFAHAAGDVLLQAVCRAAWLPLLLTDAPTHVLCLLLDALSVACLPAAARASTALAHPFYFATSEDYTPPALEEGGSAAYDGSSAVTAVLKGFGSPERRRSFLSQPRASLTATTVAATPANSTLPSEVVAAARELFVRRTTEASVAARCEHLLSAFAAPAEALKAALTRLVALFPQYATTLGSGDGAADDDGDDWDASEDEDEGELAPGASVADELSRVRRFARLFTQRGGAEGELGPLQSHFRAITTGVSFV